MSRARLRRLARATARVERKALHVIGMCDDLPLADDDPASIKPPFKGTESTAETGAAPGAARAWERQKVGLGHDKHGKSVA
jgi:hypothetical protein